MAQGIRERVHAAAAQISAERTPTVSAVRESAGVSMADASRYLKEWKADQQKAAGQIIAAPPAVLEHAQKLAGALWAEAVRLAGEQHTGIQAAWERERADLAAEVQELVGAADAADTAHQGQLAEAQKSLTEALAAAKDATAKAEAVQRDLTAAAAQNNTLREQLAAAQATAAVLQASMNAVVARIPATAPESAAGEPATGES